MKKFIIITPVILIIFAGCGLWADFTAYFNAYYNASTLFEKAETTIKNEKRSVFSLTPPTVRTDVNSNLQKVIEKCSKILEFYQRSSLADDALLMLAKSFYYQREYLKAIRKLEELEANYPKSDLITEAVLWKCRALIMNKYFEEAEKVVLIAEESAIQEENDDLLALIYIEKVKLYLHQNDISEALKLCDEIVRLSGNDVLNAEIMFETAKLYASIEDYDQSIEYFSRVSDYEPSFDIDFHSKLNMAKTLKFIDNNEAALSILTDARSEYKYSDYYPLIDLEIALTNLELNNIDKALSQFINVDTLYKTDSASGAAQFHLGEIHRSLLHDYKEAKYYYNKTASSPAPNEIKRIAKRNADNLEKYFSYKEKIAEANRDLYYINNPGEFEKDSAAIAEKIYIRDSLQKLNQNIENTQHTRTQVETRTSGGRDRKDIGRQTVSQTERGREPEPEIKLVQLKRSSIGEDSLIVLLTKLEYEIGNLFFTELNEPDSAFNYYLHASYRKGGAYKPLVLYALGSFYLSNNENLRADSLFALIYDNHKEHEIVNAVAARLNKPLIDFDYDPAKELYLEAERKMLKGSYWESIKDYLFINNNYPSSSYSLKSLYAAGFVYENKLFLLDSAAAMYENLYKQSVSSEYSKEVIGKLTAYRKEQQRIKAQRDSIENARNMVLHEETKTTTIEEELKEDKPEVKKKGLKTGEETERREPVVEKLELNQELLERTRTKRDTNNIKDMSPE